MSSSRPPVVNPKDIRPLPKDLLGSRCAECDKPHAKWEYIIFGHREKKKLMCSCCMLYRSKLGNAFNESVSRLIREVEVEMRTEFPKKDGKLYRVDDADRIMMAIVLANRVHAVRDLVTLSSVFARGRRP